MEKYIFPRTKIILINYIWPVVVVVGVLEQNLSPRYCWIVCRTCRHPSPSHNPRFPPMREIIVDAFGATIFSDCIFILTMGLLVWPRFLKRKTTFVDSVFKAFIRLEPVRQGESVIADCLPSLCLVHEDRVEVGGGAGRETLALLPQQEVPALLHPLTLLALPGHLLQALPGPHWPVLRPTGLLQAPPDVVPVAGSVGGEGG